MATSCSLPAMYSCGHRLEDGDAALGLLESPCDAHAGRERLQHHMAEDGYLFLRGCLDKEEVLAARRHILTQLSADGQLDPSAPLMAGQPKPDAHLFFQPELAQKNNPPLQHLLYHPQGNLMRFFSSFLGGEIRHFDFTWLRCVSPGPGTPSHCDIVYMGRGTSRLYTAWVPLGDIDFDLGGLMLLEGSHRNVQLQKTYGQRDVDAYCSNRPNDPARTANGLNGWLSDDPNRIRHSLGGRWLTADYRIGDVVIFCMNLVHGGMDNRSNRLRISSDSRYQLASEPADERWIGENPPGHGAAGKRGKVC
jgi:hypothetical protein